MSTLTGACAACGVSLADPARGMCAHHIVGPPNWAAGNRALCNLIHRGVPLARLPAHERDEYAWPNAEES